MRRVWPNRIAVHLEEHHPAAFWGDDKLVNTEGEVFEANLGDVEDDNLPTLSKAFGCPLCSTGGMGPALNSSLTLAILPEQHSPPLAVIANTDLPARFTWPSANPRAPPVA